MDAMVIEALDSLATALSSLLAEPKPALLIFPTRIVPTGLGSFIGLHHEPEGDLMGRRIQATVSMAIQAANANDLGAAITTTTRALLAADPSVLRQLGILSLTLDELGPKTAGSAGDPMEQELRFTILFEYVRKPTEAQGIIQEIHLTLNDEHVVFQPKE
jgi:hypothetical protein